MVTLKEMGFTRDRLFLIAGPCVIESPSLALGVASILKRECDLRSIPWIFKSSFLKANRTSIHSFSGPGRKDGLRTFEMLRDVLKIRLLTDVHETTDIADCCKVVDMLQIPAFLCRQTPLLIQAGISKLPVNIKKGQFCSPEDMRYAVEKIHSTGNKEVVLTERGSSFGYHNLVVDMRSFSMMEKFSALTVIDATHSVQLPGALGNRSGGSREHVRTIACAGVAAGAHGVFVETHPNPDAALCDGPNSLPLEDVPELLDTLLEIHNAVKGLRRGD